MKLFIFDLQRFSAIKTVNTSGAVLSFSDAADTSSSGSNITDYVKTIESGANGLTVTKGDNTSYTVTLQSGGATDVFSTSADGLVPKPSSSDSTYFLTAAGTWATVTASSAPITRLSTVSSTVEGSMWLV